MVAEWFREHLSDIRNLMEDKEVASHFNLPGHSIDDVTVSGVSYQPIAGLCCITEAIPIRNLAT